MTKFSSTFLIQEGFRDISKEINDGNSYFQSDHICFDIRIKNHKDVFVVNHNGKESPMPYINSEKDLETFKSFLY